MTIFDKFIGDSAPRTTQAWLETINAVVDGYQTDFTDGLRQLLNETDPAAIATFGNGLTLAESTINARVKACGVSAEEIAACFAEIKSWYVRTIGSEFPAKERDRKPEHVKTAQPFAKKHATCTAQCKALKPKLQAKLEAKSNGPQKEIDWSDPNQIADFLSENE